MISENYRTRREHFAVHFDSLNYASSLTLHGGGDSASGVNDNPVANAADCPSEVSESSWVHLSGQSSQRPPPPAPIPIPSPAINARGLADQVPDSTLLPEAILNAPDGDLESGVSAEEGRRQERRRSLVDGFISGLKKLPKAVMKTYYSTERKTERGTVPVIGAVTAKPPAALSPIADSGLYSAEPTPLTPNGAPTGPSRPPYPPSNGEAIAPHHVLLTPPGVNSPVLVEPRPSSDYAKMESPVAAPEPSLGHYISRVHQFLKDVNDLPWVSPRTTVDYIPGQSSRSRSRSQRTQVPGRPSTTLSWYAPPLHQSLDLLSSGPSAMARLPDSSVTLAYQPPDLVSPVVERISGSQVGKQAHSRSLTTYGGPRLSGNQYPYPIPRPPPARTS